MSENGSSQTRAKDVRILLIHPPLTLPIVEAPSLEPPLGLAYLAAYVEKAGYEVRILDAVASGVMNIKREGDYVRVGLDDADIEDYIRDFAPQVVGVSAAFTETASDSHHVAGLVKGVDPKILVVFGGAHTTALPEQVLMDGNVDMVVKGEGEATLLEIAESFSDKSRLNRLEGTVVRSGDSVLHNPVRPFIADLDSMPFPAYHLLPMEVYLYKGRYYMNDWAMRPPRLNMTTSRGCPGRCVFCSIHGIWGFEWRSRSPKNVADEIETLKRDWKIGEVAFQDDNISLDRDRMMAICDQMIDRKLDIRWCTPNGVAIYTLDEELVRKMRKSGCWRLSFGIESAWPETQKFIGKRIPVEKVDRAIKWANDCGIWTHGTFVMGFPYETRESIEATVKYATESELDFAHMYLATPYPGTKLYDIVKAEGLLPDDIKLWSANKAEWDTKFMTREELNRIRTDAYSAILGRRMRRYLNPLRVMKKVKSWEDFKFIFRLAKLAVQMKVGLMRQGELLTHWKGGDS
jgi:anaerobic magnesium-protoporphyrin IX monomethyl ester cyclase